MATTAYELVQEARRRREQSKARWISEADNYGGVGSAYVTKQVADLDEAIAALKKIELYLLSEQI